METKQVSFKGDYVQSGKLIKMLLRPSTRRKIGELAAKLPADNQIEIGFSKFADNIVSDCYKGKKSIKGFYLAHNKRGENEMTFDFYTIRAFMCDCIFNGNPYIKYLQKAVDSSIKTMFR